MKALIAAVPLFAIACSQAPEIAPEKAGEQPHRQEVRLSEDAVRAAGIEAFPVSREAFHPHVVASGIIRPVAQKSVTVRSLVGGRVVRVLATRRLGRGRTGRQDGQQQTEKPGGPPRSASPRDPRRLHAFRW